MCVQVYSLYKIAVMFQCDDGLFIPMCKRSCDTQSQFKMTFSLEDMLEVSIGSDWQIF